MCSGVWTEWLLIAQLISEAVCSLRLYEANELVGRLITASFERILHFSSENRQITRTRTHTLVFMMHENPSESVFCRTDFMSRVITNTYWEHWIKTWFKQTVTSVVTRVRLCVCVCVLLVRLSAHTHMKCDPSVSCGGEGGGGGEEEELGDWGGVDRLFTAKPTEEADR